MPLHQRHCSPNQHQAVVGQCEQVWPRVGRLAGARSSHFGVLGGTGWVQWVSLETVVLPDEGAEGAEEVDAEPSARPLPSPLPSPPTSAPCSTRRDALVIGAQLLLPQMVVAGSPKQACKLAAAVWQAKAAAWSRPWSRAQSRAVNVANWAQRGPAGQGSMRHKAPCWSIGAAVVVRPGAELPDRSRQPSSKRTLRCTLNGAGKACCLCAPPRCLLAGWQSWSATTAPPSFQIRQAAEPRGTPQAGEEGPGPFSHRPGSHPLPACLIADLPGDRAVP